MIGLFKRKPKPIAIIRIPIDLYEQMGDSRRRLYYNGMINDYHVIMYGTNLVEKEIDIKFHKI